MSFDNIKNYIIVAFCSSFSVYLKSTLTLQGCEAIWVPPSGAIGLYILLHLLIRLPLLFRPCRMFVRPEAKIEGDWLEHVIKDGKRYYSLFSVCYIWKSNCHIISGIALTDSGQIHAHWNSTNFTYDENLLELRYFHISVQQGKADIPGFTRLSFFRAKKGQLEEGNGYFIDMNDTALRCDFSFKRVKPELIEKVLNVKNVKQLSGNLRETFIKAYHKMQEGT